MADTEAKRKAEEAVLTLVLTEGLNNIRAKMQFSEDGQKYLRFGADKPSEKSEGYVSIISTKDADGKDQYVRATFDELHNAVVALLENEDAKIRVGKTTLDKENNPDTIRQIVAQYFYICSRMESDLDLIKMEEFWKAKGKYSATEEELEALNKELHVKLDLTKLQKPCDRNTFYGQLYVSYYVPYKESTRDATQFNSTIDKIKKVYKRLGITPATKAADSLDDSVIKYEYIKAASSVMSYSQAQVYGKKYPVGVTCNIPFSQQTYAFEAVKDLCKEVTIYYYEKGHQYYCSYKKPDCEFESCTRFELLGKPESVTDDSITDDELKKWQHLQLRELLKTLYLNRIINSEGNVVTIGMPLNFIDALAPHSKILYKKIAQEVLKDLVNNAEKYGIKDKLIVADGFNTQDTPQPIEQGDVRLVFAGQGQYPITALAGLHDEHIEKNLFNYDEIRVYKGGNIVLVKNKPVAGQAKYCVNGNTSNDLDITRFGEVVATYNVTDVSLDALGDHLGAVGRYCSNTGGDRSADGVITGLPGVVECLYGLGNPQAIEDYQEKYKQLSEKLPEQLKNLQVQYDISGKKVEFQAFVDPEQAKIEILEVASKTEEQPVPQFQPIPQPQLKPQQQPQPAPQEFNANAIAKQIFKINQNRTPTRTLAADGLTITESAPKQKGFYFDFENVARISVKYTNESFGNPTISLLQIINKEKFTVTDAAKNSAIIDLSEDRDVILGVGNNGEIQYEDLANTVSITNLQELLEKILETLNITEYDLTNIDNEQAKQVFEELLGLLHKDLKSKEIYNLIFAKTREFLNAKTPEERNNLRVNQDDISATFLRDTSTMSEQIRGRVSEYLEGLQKLELSEKNIFDQIEEVFAYYREKGADNLDTNQMLDFYGAFYNAVSGEELESDSIKYKIIDRDGKKFIIVNPEYLKEIYKALEQGGNLAGRFTPKQFIQKVYEGITKNNEELQRATLVIPSLTDYQQGGHYVAYVYPKFIETFDAYQISKDSLNSSDDGRQEFAEEQERHFGSLEQMGKGAGFCGLHAVEAVMALTTGVQLIGKNKNVHLYFKIDTNGTTTYPEQQELLPVFKPVDYNEAEKPANLTEYNFLHFFNDKDNKGYYDIEQHGKNRTNKNKDFVIVNAGNSSLEIGGVGLNGACKKLYGEGKHFNSTPAVWPTSLYTKQVIGCKLVQWKDGEQTIPHLYAVGPNYNDYNTGNDEEKKQHFFKDLQAVNDAIFEAIRSNYKTLKNKTIFFSGVSNYTFAGEKLKAPKIKDKEGKDIEGANIVDYFNAFCFMQFIQDHKIELEQHNIHIYLNKSISLAVQALCNEQTRGQVLELLNKNIELEEKQTFAYTPNKGFELEKKDEEDGDSGYSSDSEDDTESTDGQSGNSEDETPKTTLEQSQFQSQTLKSQQSEFETLEKKSPAKQLEKGNIDKHLSEIIQDKIDEISKTLPPETRATLQEQQTKKSSQIKALKALKSMAKIYEQGKIINTNIEFKNGKISPLKNSSEEVKQRLEVLQKIYEQSAYGEKSITMDAKIEGTDETYRKEVLSELFANEFLEAAKETSNNPNNTIHDFEITRNINTGVLTIKVEGIGEYVLPTSIELGQVNEVVKAISEQNMKQLQQIGIKIEGDKIDELSDRASSHRAKVLHNRRQMQQSNIRAMATSGR